MSTVCCTCVRLTAVKAVVTTTIFVATYNYFHFIKCQPPTFFNVSSGFCAGEYRVRMCGKDQIDVQIKTQKYIDKLASIPEDYPIRCTQADCQTFGLEVCICDSPRSIHSNLEYWQPRQEECSLENYLDTVCNIPDECSVDANCLQVRLNPAPICCSDLSAEIDRDCEPDPAFTANLEAQTKCSTQPPCPTFS